MSHTVRKDGAKSELKALKETAMQIIDDFKTRLVKVNVLGLKCFRLSHYWISTVRDFNQVE